MFEPRMTADQLCGLYGTAKTALASGDFYTALRLADGDPLVGGAALVMLGHGRRGLALLEGGRELPDWARLVRALGLWLGGDNDDEARGVVGDLTVGAPGYGPAQALVRAMATQRPHIVYACGAANTLRAADQLKASDDARVTVLRNVPHKADVAFGPSTPADRLAAAIGADVDCVFIDNLIMLPPQLAAIPAPKIAQVFDIEFFYAQRGRELGWIDLLVCPGNSMDHASARLRFGDHCLQRAVALDELMQVEIDLEAMQSDDGERPIDVLATGGVDKPFFPDKQHRFGALAQADPALDIRVIGRYLPAERYLALTRAAKYALASNRASNAILGRAFEALAAGTLVACEADSALPLLFGDDLAGMHCYRDGHVARDVARLVAGYPDNRAAFVRGAPALAEALRSVLPNPEQASRRMVRTLTFWSAMARARLGWRDVFRGGPAAPRRALAPAAADCYAAKQESWLGLPRDLRGRLLAPLAEVSQEALAMPRLGQTVTAQVFMAVNHLDADLYRHQAEGQQAAGAVILRTLNQARRLRPLSLATWFLIGRHLADAGRFGAAIRLFEQLVLRADALVLEDRVSIGDSVYEVADWPFVDAMMRDDLCRQHPLVCGRRRDQARGWILGRAHAMLAVMHGRQGDGAAFDHYASHALRHAVADMGVLGLVMDGAIAAWQADEDPARLRRALLSYFRAMRRSLRFLFDRFPEALELLAHLGRERLAVLLVRYWLRAKLRLFLDGDAPVVADEERFIHERHAQLFRLAAQAFADTRLAPRVETLLAAMAVTDSRSAAG